MKQALQQEFTSRSRWLLQILGKGWNGEKSRGFTLIELMIVTAISGVVLASVFQMFVGQRKTYSLQNDIAEMQQNARASEHMLVREIRMAGYKVPDRHIEFDVPGASFSDGEKEAFEETTSQSIAFTSDVDGDGTMETIRYSLRKSGLMREMWRWKVSEGRWKRSGGARVLAENIEQLDLSYGILADDEGLDNDRDDDGDAYVDEEGELFFSTQPKKEEREYIKVVKVSLTAKSSRPDPAYVHPVYGDHFRRTSFSTSIKPRNMGL